MSRAARFSFWLIFWLPGPGAAAWQQPLLPGGQSHSYVSPIAPDLDIVTEVSRADPYAGQQFSVIYRLRARGAVSAVDIDPQQYPGFWTEVVPVPPATPPMRRLVKGRTAYEFLLRQVIAFPLLEGERSLPPLSLKIKREGRLSSSRDDWDLAGKSEPVVIRVRPLPPAPAPVEGLPLVGEIEGSLGDAEDGRRPPSCTLEIEGTANLALFRAGDFLRASGGNAVSARLLVSDKVVRTLDVEGQRRLSLLQRQQWAVRLLPGNGRASLEDIRIPLFQPAAGKWDTIRIKGVAFSPRENPGIRKEAAGSKPGFDAAVPSGWSRWQSYGVAALAAAAIVLLAAGLRKRHVGKRGEQRPNREFGKTPSSDAV